MVPGSSGRILSGTAALLLISNTMERKVTTGLLYVFQFISKSSLFIRNTYLSMCLSFLGPCHKSCGDYCWGPNEKQCQICERPRVVFPLPPLHFTSLYLFKATQKYPETDTHTKIQHAYTFM